MWIVWLTLALWSLPGFAQEAKTAGPVITEKMLNERLGAQWRGLVYVCDPYCRFLSIREVDHWNPVVDRLPGAIDKMQAIAQTDPLYPLLISRHPVLPYVNQDGVKAGTDEGNQGQKKLSPPSYAETSYSIAWSLNLGESLHQRTLTSNTEIQSNLVPKSYFMGPQLGATVTMRPHSLLNQWIQHFLLIDYGSASYSTVDGVGVTTKRQALSYRAWRLGERFKTGPRLSFEKEAVQVKSNTLTHFSYAKTAYLLGWDVVWKRWFTKIDLAFKSDLEEEQSFRQAPLKQSWYRAGLGYCSRNFVVFDLSFGFCGQLDYSKDQQSAPLANNLISGTDSKIDISGWDAWISLRVGEDFFR